MVGHERTGGGRQQDLPTVGRGTDSRGTRDSEADVAVAVKLRIAGMDAHPHLDLHAVRPLLLGERLLRVGGRLSRVTSPREDDEEGFGLAIDGWDRRRPSVPPRQASMSTTSMRPAKCWSRPSPSMSVKRRVDSAAREIGHTLIVVPCHERVATMREGLNPYSVHFAITSAMSHYSGAALASAEAQVAAARRSRGASCLGRPDLPRADRPRLRQHLPFRWRRCRSCAGRRAAVLDLLDASPPGSVWWRAVNERLLRDDAAVALVGGLAGEPSSQPVRLWLEFIARPTGRNWYELTTRASWLPTGAPRLAQAESAPERFFMDVALVRVLYAHALVGAPRLALGRFAPLGRLLGESRLGMAGVFLSLRRVLPNRYPLALDVERYIADEQRLGRL